MRQQLRRIPQAYQDVVEQELQELLDSRMIEPSSSERALPIVIVKKKDKSVLIYTGYRKVNSATETDM